MAVAFAIVAIQFFSFVFGILELARAIYLFNTLQEVNRRAAAMAVNSPFDNTTVSDIRKATLFSDASGNFLLGEPITPDHLRIDYQSLAKDAGSGALTLQSVAPMPPCPAKNKLNCLSDPYSASCIRFVRVLVCQPDDVGSCTAVPY